MMPINNALIGLTSFYNPHPGGAEHVQTRTEYYVDYLRDATLAKYTADAVGQFVQRASTSQVAAMQRLGSQFESSIARQTAQISSALSAGFSMLNDRLGALEECQRATVMLTGNIAQLLRIPDSERQRQHAIEMGLKFLSNARHDQDLFEDALEEFLKAEKLQSQDYFVLQKIGMIYLYVLVDLRLAADYLTRAGKYAAVESHSSSVTSRSLLALDPSRDFAQQSGLQSHEIARMAAESYIAASRAEYALGNLNPALQLAQKAVKLCPALPAALLQQGKCAASSGQPVLATSSVRHAIAIRPSVGTQVAGDLDLLAIPAVTDLLAKSTTFIKLDVPFDPDAIDALRQRPIAVALQQAWQKIGRFSSALFVKWQPLGKAISQGSANEEEVLLFATCALRSGNVVAWGCNEEGQATVPADLSDVSAIAAGWRYTVALKSDGTVVAWGNAGMTVPVGLSRVTAIAAGSGHTGALQSDGNVVAWGDNKSGQAAVPSNLHGVVAIAAGGSHTVALKSDGTVASWGFNNDGQIRVPFGLRGVTAVAAGGYHTVALKSDGTVVAWGNNKDGQATILTGLSEVLDIAAGYAHTVARIESRVLTEPGSDLALQFFKLGCALIAAADVKLSSREQLWLDTHLGAGASTEILSFITSLGPDGLQTELQTLASRLTPEDKHWLHCRAWQLEDLAAADGTEAEEQDAVAFVLDACGWYQLEEPLRAYLLRG